MNLNLKSVAKRIHFSPEDDLHLAREVVGQKPFEDPGRWHLIQINIMQISGKSDGEDPVPVGVGGDEAGPSRSLTDNCKALAEKQPKRQGKGIARYVEGRRDSVESIDLVWDEEMQKSVPKKTDTAFPKPFGTIARSFSFKTASTSTKNKKRKVMDTSLRETEPVYNTKESSEAFVLMEAIEVISKLSKTLCKQVEQNTKREIKEIVPKLEHQVALMNRLSIQSWLEKHRYEGIPKMLFDGETQTEERDAINATRMQMADQGTQTEAAGPPERGRKLVIQRVPLKHKIPEGTATLTWTTAEAFARDYPDGEIPKPGQVVAVKRRIISSVGEKNVKESSTTTWLLMQESGGEPMECRRVRQTCFKGIADKLLREGTSKMAIRMMQGVALEEEIVEAIGHVKLEVMLMGEWKQSTWSEAVKGSRGKEGAVSAASAQEREKPSRMVRKPKPGTVTISTKEKGYEETLREVRKLTKEDGGEARIKNIRESRAGNVILETDGEETASKLVVTLQTLKARAVRDTGGAEVVGMDALATKEEVGEALKAALGADATMAELTVIAMRATYGRTQAARFTASKTAVSRLVEIGRIRVGPVVCRIRETVEDDRCYKCQESGHRAAECKGPDRSTCCFRCGKPGHKARACTDSKRCLRCGRDGHRTSECELETTQNDKENVPLNVPSTSLVEEDLNIRENSKENEIFHEKNSQCTLKLQGKVLICIRHMYIKLTFVRQGFAEKQHPVFADLHDGHLPHNQLATPYKKVLADFNVMYPDKEFGLHANLDKEIAIIIEHFKETKVAIIKKFLNLVQTEQNAETDQEEILFKELFEEQEESLENSIEDETIKNINRNKEPVFCNPLIIASQADIKDILEAIDPFKGEVNERLYGLQLQVERLENLILNPTQPLIEEGEENLELFPLSTITGVNNFERKLTNENSKKKMIIHLKKIVGSGFVY
ncbi:unnamed protein product [Brassicogethes aeneus]|uniref:Zinc finger CCHC domain-containing protein 7 n=1 Tax=Brassicogethes aeneus TaxID=1431903 RepID=A0A9P0BGJ7_BRAAE|nr:unnamed protein product [Brassicogethes aeneus]